ncbi:MAG: aminopeptidase P family N-terminal domain-containing protein [Rhizobiaceae bacterium]|nr:aminopeptidase P family N-terminal domain-containing protein [Rhizobiaceae bacterium]
MRRGLIKWREDELSAGDVGERIARLRGAMKTAGLDAVIAYTTLVRPAAVNYFTGFTPYWSDGVLLVLAEGRPLFVTALSKRVGNWLGSVNPTCDILHSPKPGRLIGETLRAAGALKVGAVEADMMPGALIGDMLAASSVALSDATGLFAAVRAVPTSAETALAQKADAIASTAFAGLDLSAACVGDITGPLERAVRLAGAEECYVAIAPDLRRESRLARIDGREALGDLFAARVSVAYNGVWTRRTETLAHSGGRDGAAAARFAEFADRLAGLDPSIDLGARIAAEAGRSDMAVEDWSIEAPFATRPLKLAASSQAPLVEQLPYGVLTLRARIGDAPMVASRVLTHSEAGMEAAA